MASSTTCEKIYIIYYKVQDKQYPENIFGNCDEKRGLCVGKREFLNRIVMKKKVYLSGRENFLIVSVSAPIFISIFQ